MFLTFEWDKEKNALNKMKHGISFENAKMVFYDPMLMEIYDMEHSFIEGRWMAVGLAGLNVFTVSFTERNCSIRIISARKADRDEEERYFYGYSTGNSI
jgi:uncharacterized DUF497 family protein